VPQSLLQAVSEKFLLSLSVRAEKATYKIKTGSFQRPLTNVVADLSVCVHFREILASNLGPKTEYPEQGCTPGYTNLGPKTEYPGQGCTPGYIKSVPTDRSGIGQSAKCLPMGCATEVRFTSGIGISFFFAATARSALQTQLA
jgi:hypothetical protein